jgi:peptidyl-prolyl cis-trans isomerase B (cyclophilin B)
VAKKTRQRQLARSAERRYEERRQARRKRINIAIAVVAVLVVAGIAFLVVRKNGNNEAKPHPSGSATASPAGSVSATPAASGSEPKVTGQVKPQAKAPKKVACGGTVPKQAGQPKPQFDVAPDPAKELQAGRTYTATIETSCGSFDVALDQQTAPKAVASFVFLANKGFFDGLTFHRVIDGFMFQGGDPLGTGTGGPGYQFPIETDPSVTFGKPGVLAMANAGPGTNGSQWFVTLGADTNLNPSASGSYTIFGHVTGGMSVVDKIGKVPVKAAPGSGGGEKSAPTQAVYIDKVTIQAG